MSFRPPVSNNRDTGTPVVINDDGFNISRGRTRTQSTLHASPHAQSSQKYQPKSSQFYNKVNPVLEETGDCETDPDAPPPPSPTSQRTPLPIQSITSQTPSQTSDRNTSDQNKPETTTSMQSSGLLYSTQTFRKPGQSNAQPQHTPNQRIPSIECDSDIDQPPTPSQGPQPTPSTVKSSFFRRAFDRLQGNDREDKAGANSNESQPQVKNPPATSTPSKTPTTTPTPLSPTNHTSSMTTDDELDCLPPSQFQSRLQHPLKHSGSISNLSLDSFDHAGQNPVFLGSKKQHLESSGTFPAAQKPQTSSSALLQTNRNPMHISRKSTDVIRLARVFIDPAILDPNWSPSSTPSNDSTATSNVANTSNTGLRPASQRHFSISGRSSQTCLTCHFRPTGDQAADRQQILQAILLKLHLSTESTEFTPRSNGDLYGSDNMQYRLPQGSVSTVHNPINTGVTVVGGDDFLALLGDHHFNDEITSRQFRSGSEESDTIVAAFDEQEKVAAAPSKGSRFNTLFRTGSLKQVNTPDKGKDDKSTQTQQQQQQQQGADANKGKGEQKLALTHLTRQNFNMDHFALVPYTSSGPAPGDGGFSQQISGQIPSNQSTPPSTTRRQTAAQNQQNQKPSPYASQFNSLSNHAPKPSRSATQYVAPDDFDDDSLNTQSSLRKMSISNNGFIMEYQLIRTKTVEMQYQVDTEVPDVVGTIDNNRIIHEGDEGAELDYIPPPPAPSISTERTSTRASVSTTSIPPPPSTGDTTPTANTPVSTNHVIPVHLQDTPPEPINSPSSDNLVQSPSASQIPTSQSKLALELASATPQPQLDSPQQQPATPSLLDIFPPGCFLPPNVDDIQFLVTDTPVLHLDLIKLNRIKRKLPRTLTFTPTQLITTVSHKLDCFDNSQLQQQLLAAELHEQQQNAQLSTLTQSPTAPNCSTADLHANCTGRKSNDCNASAIQPIDGAHRRDSSTARLNQHRRTQSTNSNLFQAFDQLHSQAQPIPISGAALDVRNEDDNQQHQSTAAPTSEFTATNPAPATTSNQSQPASYLSGSNVQGQSPGISTQQIQQQPSSISASNSLIQPASSTTGSQTAQFNKTTLQQQQQQQQQLQQQHQFQSVGSQLNPVVTPYYNYNDSPDKCPRCGEIQETTSTTPISEVLYSSVVHLHSIRLTYLNRASQLYLTDNAPLISTMINLYLSLIRQKNITGAMSDLNKTVATHRILASGAVRFISVKLYNLLYPSETPIPGSKNNEIDLYTAPKITINGQLFVHSTFSTLGKSIILHQYLPHVVNTQFLSRVYPVLHKYITAKGKFSPPLPFQALHAGREVPQDDYKLDPSTVVADGVFNLFLTGGISFCPPLSHNSTSSIASLQKQNTKSGTKRGDKKSGVEHTKFGQHNNTGLNYDEGSDDELTMGSNYNSHSLQLNYTDLQFIVGSTQSQNSSSATQTGQNSDGDESLVTNEQGTSMKAVIPITPLGSSPHCHSTPSSIPTSLQQTSSAHTLHNSQPKPALQSSPSFPQSSPLPHSVSLLQCNPAALPPAIPFQATLNSSNLHNYLASSLHTLPSITSSNASLHTSQSSSHFSPHPTPIPSQQSQSQQSQQQQQQQQQQPDSNETTKLDEFLTNIRIDRSYIDYNNQFTPEVLQYLASAQAAQRNQQLKQHGLITTPSPQVLSSDPSKTNNGATDPHDTEMAHIQSKFSQSAHFQSPTGSFTTPSHALSRTQAQRTSILSNIPALPFLFVQPTLYSKLLGLTISPQCWRLIIKLMLICSQPAIFKTVIQTIPLIHDNHHQILTDWTKAYDQYKPAYDKYYQALLQKQQAKYKNADTNGLYKGVNTVYTKNAAFENNIALTDDDFSTVDPTGTSSSMLLTALTVSEDIFDVGDQNHVFNQQYLSKQLREQVAKIDREGGVLLYRVKQLTSALSQYVSNPTQTTTGQSENHYDELLDLSTANFTTTHSYTTLPHCYTKPSLIENGQPDNDVVDHAIQFAIELVITPPLTPLIDIYLSLKCHSRDYKLYQICLYHTTYKKNKQNDYNIPIHLQSPDKWITAITTLKQITTVYTAVERLQCLLTCCKYIYHTYKLLIQSRTAATSVVKQYTFTGLYPDDLLDLALRPSSSSSSSSEDQVQQDQAQLDQPQDSAMNTTFTRQEDLLPHLPLYNQHITKVPHPTPFLIQRLLNYPEKEWTTNNRRNNKGKSEEEINELMAQEVNQHRYIRFNVIPSINEILDARYGVLIQFTSPHPKTAPQTETAGGESASSAEPPTTALNGEFLLNQFILTKDDIGPSSSLCADDFFPIFVYVVVNAKIAKLETIKQFIGSMAPRVSLTGEVGYYFTVFEAVIEYIETLAPQ